MIKRWARELSWLAAGQFVAVAGSIGLVQVSTHYLSPAIYGEVTLALSAATLVQLVGFGPIAQGALRYFSAAREAGESRAYIVTILGVTAKFCLGLAALGAGVMLAVGVWFEQLSPQLVLVTLLYSIMSGISSIVDAVQTAARRRAVVAIHLAAGQWLRIGLTLLAVTIIGANATIVLYAFVVASALVLLSQLILLVRAVEADREPLLARTTRWHDRIMAYCWPFAFWGVFAWLQVAADRWSLQTFMDTSAVGQYAVLYQVGYGPIVMLSTLAGQFLSPLLFEKSGMSDDARRIAGTQAVSERLIWGALALTFIATISAYVVHSVFFRIMVGEAFRAVSYLLPLAVLAGGLFGTGQMAALSLMAAAQPARLIAPKVVSGIVAVASNAFAVHYYGLQGAVYALVFSAGVFCIWMVIAKKSADLTLPLEPIARPESA